jgi:hypothetical protein
MLTLLLALAVLSPPACAPEFAPLETGSFSFASHVPFWRKAEAGAWGGAGWLGWTSNRDELRAVRLVVRNRPKQEEDDEAFVTVEAVPRVTFAVRCVTGMRARSIQRASVTEIALLTKRSATISLGSREYALKLESAQESMSDAKVILTEGNRTQVLYSADGFADDPHFDVYWAGDLDGDGKLDLVVDFSRKYSVLSYRLLLSTRARPGQLVGDAALFQMEN